LTIRAATPNDASAVFTLLHELGYESLEADKFGIAFQAVLNHSEMHVLVAEDADRNVLGMISVSHRPQLHLGGTIVTIDELVVTAQARGTGAGRALLEHARKIAGDLGAQRLELTTNRSRESYARAFYTKNGFSEVNSAVLRSK
jgi:GNAT superfamily N-acetyltransferase